jgi:hypothetical protein
MAAISRDIYRWLLLPSHHKWSPTGIGHVKFRKVLTRQKIIINTSLGSRIFLKNMQWLKIYWE